MKLGILTTYHSFEYNYGAALQGFALAKQLQLMGHECYVINYIGNEWTPSSNTMRDRLNYIFSGGNLTMKILQRLYKRKNTVLLYEPDIPAQHISGFPCPGL